MTSYYVDGLLCKYTASRSLFPYPERASCRFGPSGEEHGSVRPAAAISFEPSLSGVYSVNNDQARFSQSYSQGLDALPPHCSPLESRQLTASRCHPGRGPLTSPPDKQYRIYPWMRASGMCAHILLGANSKPAGQCFYKTSGYVHWPLVVQLIS